jgi:hypothetical protein
MPKTFHVDIYLSSVIILGMDNLFNMMAQWQPLGQGVFLLIVLSMCLTCLYQVVQLIAVMLRGWPTRPGIK